MKGRRRKTPAAFEAQSEWGGSRKRFRLDKEDQVGEDDEYEYEEEEEEEEGEEEESSASSQHEESEEEEEADGKGEKQKMTQVEETAAQHRKRERLRRSLASQPRLGPFRDRDFSSSGPQALNSLFGFPHANQLVSSTSSDSVILKRTPQNQTKKDRKSEKANADNKYQKNKAPSIQDQGNEEWNIARRTRAHLSLEDKTVEELGADEDMLNRLLLQEIWDEDDENHNLYKQFLLNDLPSDDEEEEYKPKPRRINKAFTTNTHSLSSSTSSFPSFSNSSHHPVHSQLYSKPQDEEKERKREQARIALRTRAHLSFADKDLDELANALMEDEVDEDEEEEEEEQMEKDEQRKFYHSFVQQTLHNENPVFAPMQVTAFQQPILSSPAHAELDDDDDLDYVQFEDEEEEEEDEDEDEKDEEELENDVEPVEPKRLHLGEFLRGSQVPPPSMSAQYERLHGLLQRFTALAIRQDLHDSMVSSSRQNKNKPTESETAQHMLEEMCKQKTQSKRGRKNTVVPSIFQAKGVADVPAYLKGSTEVKKTLVANGCIGTALGSRLRTRSFFIIDQQQEQQQPAVTERSNKKQTGTLGKNGRQLFTAGEDILLLQGLRKFVETRFNSIATYYFQCRGVNARQLGYRFKNLVNMKHEHRYLVEELRQISISKDRYFAALTHAELLRLSQGLARFGNDFAAISRHMLPHRSADVLRFFFDRESLGIDDFPRNSVDSRKPQRVVWDLTMDRELLLCAQKNKNEKPMQRWTTARKALATLDPDYAEIPTSEIALRFAVLLVAHRFRSQAQQQASTSPC